MFMEKVRLEEAMTMELEQPFRTWELSGLHVEDEDIPKDANVTATVVMLNPNRNRFNVGVDFYVDEKAYIGTIAEFSNLEELRKAFPHLFELDGNLYAFF